MVVIGIGLGRRAEPDPHPAVILHRRLADHMRPRSADAMVFDDLVDQDRRRSAGVNRLAVLKPNIARRVVAVKA